MTDFDHSFPLADFVAGQLSETENMEVIEHLETCASCEAEVERLWQESEAGRTLPHVPMSDAASTRRVQNSLFRRIHRTDLSGQLVKLGTESFINLMIALVRPIVGGFRSSSGVKRR